MLAQSIKQHNTPKQKYTYSSSVSYAVRSAVSATSGLLNVTGRLTKIHISVGLNSVGL